MNNRDILDSIKKYNEMSLEDYFSCSDDALLKVITTFEEVNYIGDYHDECAEKLCNYLYGTSYDDDYFATFFNSNGCITIQVMKNDFIIINIPRYNGDYVVNSYQFEVLFNFYQDVMNINRKRKEKIELHTNVFDGDSHLSLAGALIYLKRRIDDDVWHLKNNNNLHR